MWRIRFDPHQEIPLVDAFLVGPLGGRRVRLVFDTGGGSTQIDTDLMESIGYNASLGTGIITVRGPAGDVQQGYSVRAEKLNVFRRSFQHCQIGVYDFDNFSHYGIDGILGWDIIRQLHLEMNGPEGELTVFR